MASWVPCGGLLLRDVISLYGIVWVLWGISFWYWNRPCISVLISSTDASACWGHTLAGSTCIWRLLWNLPEQIVVWIGEVHLEGCFLSWSSVFHKTHWLHLSADFENNVIFFHFRDAVLKGLQVVEEWMLYFFEFFVEPREISTCVCSTLVWLTSRWKMAGGCW